MNVRVWLRSLGLGQYEEKFRENKIDFDVLANLTDGDLQELGLPLGDRRRLLRAIAELGAQQPLTTQARRTPAAPARARSFVQLDSAERRHLTVMFCDLVGSTELAAALDVEDWRNLLKSYLDEASRAVTALGGHVLKMLGDGLMAVFGYPRARRTTSNALFGPLLRSSRRSASLMPETLRLGGLSLPFASASKTVPLSSTPRARCSARFPVLPRAFRQRPSPGQCWSLRRSCGTLLGCSSLRTRAPRSSGAPLSQ
jgi:class 3 adenylate cyclase